MKVIEIIKEAKKPLFTFELIPPLKGYTIDGIFDSAKTLMKYSPSYINITNHQNEVVYQENEDGSIVRKTVRKRPGTIGIAAALQYKFGIPTVPHLICGGLSDLEIENMLVDLNFLQIENVFALRGDPPVGERKFIACKDGYLHSSQMVEQIKNMNEGKYLDSTLQNPVKTNFCIGVAGYPEKHLESPNMESDIANLKKKQDAGAEYIVTQLFYNNDAYFKFVESCREAGITIPIIPGIKPLRTKRQLTMVPTTFAVDIPFELSDKVNHAKDKNEINEIGIWWATKQVKELIDRGVPGVHFYTIGSVKSVSKIVENCY
ncbi:MAG: methylenetetrahydrofolate reductase [Sphaerochaeta sp.]